MQLFPRYLLFLPVILIIGMAYFFGANAQDTFEANTLIEHGDYYQSQLDRTFIVGAIYGLSLGVLISLILVSLGLYVGAVCAMEKGRSVALSIVSSLVLVTSIVSTVSMITNQSDPTGASLSFTSGGRLLLVVVVLLLLCGVFMLRRFTFIGAMLEKRRVAALIQEKNNEQ